MKKCRIYRTYNNSGYRHEGFPGDYTRYFADAFLTDDGLVLCPDTKYETKPRYFCWDGKAETVEPSGVTETLKLYTPYWGIGLIYADELDGVSPFVVDGKWGYCNSDGEVVIEPKWDFCDMFWGDDLARVYIGEEFDPINAESENYNGLWGFIYEDGEIAIEPIYQHLNRFCIYTGFALAKKNNKWGAIRSTGSTVVDFIWDGIWFDWNSDDKDSGVIVMKEFEGRTQFSAINKHGNMIIENIPDFTPPEFPKQYACDNEDNYG
jgi:hypothetical protein